MRVAFFHPYKMADHYFVEALETAAIADLCADGHDAEAVDYLFDPAIAEDVQVEDMRAALARAGYDLIFLERPWSDAMVRALSGLPIVAYARPELVERGLVDLGVVDMGRDAVRSLVRAVAGGADLETVPGLVYRRDGAVHRTRDAAQLSVLRELGDAKLDYKRRRVLSRGVANPERAVVLSNLGCAYRNVPNRTGVFDAVPVPSGVSTAGCTFCDASAYERMTETEAIGLIVRQVEAVLRDRPGVREIAIKDDYAVRFLGRLGEALAPLGLGERRVLLSARAEYLLELRADIEEALAGRFPAPLGFYLVGFENFSQAELDRFNKGTSAEQIERVLVLMRQWSERFPSRFEVTPTGGFILFTPWTTLEDLRINGSAMRRHGFERYRGHALLSQLRLYPNLPLYWLAKHDGLLVEAFEREEMSDAHRRGYEADHPWRFRDPKVAAVHRRLLEARARSAADLFEVFEDALDDAAGVARGKKNRPLRLVRAPRDAGPAGPATTSLSLNRACNQNCGFCSSRAATDDPPRVRAARAIQGVRAAAQQGTRTLLLTGAEPLLEWYLADCIRVARDLGIREVVLETNATLLAPHGGAGRRDRAPAPGAERRGAEALAAAGLTRAVVALNSDDPAVADAISRDPGGHAATLAGVRAFLAAGVPVELAIALLPDNRGGLAAIAARALELFPRTAAGIEAVVARYVSGGPGLARPLRVLDAAAELAAGAEAAARSGVRLRTAPGGELPPCVFDAPAAAHDAMRLSEVIVERDGASYERIPACASCSAARICPGPLRAIAAEVAKVARPLGDDERASGVVPLPRERQRVLSEYKSQFFLEAPDGKVRERRIVRVVFHCNQACDFCFVSRELPAVEHELIVKELREAAERGAVLDLSGGEPTLNPRLPEYIALARQLGVPEVELQTNALAMADPDYARTLADAGLRQAFVSLHGTSAEVSDRVTAAPGTFEKTLEGARNLRAAGVAVRFNFVLCGYNVDELAGFPDFVDREIHRKSPGSIPGINFSFAAASTDNVPRDPRLIPRFSDVAWALSAAHDRAVALGIPMSGFDSKCGVPACYMPRAIRDEHFAHDIPDEERARATGFTKSDACSRCELDRRCYGIRSTYAELHGVDELRPIVGGELAPPAERAPARAPHRGSVWASIGLSPAHELRADSVARLADDGAFARPTRTWVDQLDVGSDREIVQLEGGLRQIIKVERSNRAAAEETATRMRARGLVAQIYEGPAGPGGAPPRAIAFVGRSTAAVEEAISIEPGLTAPFRERGPLVRRMGELLGYPSCCVDAFAVSPEQDDGTHIARLVRSHPGPLAAEQNWAATPLRPFSHFPCTPTCAETARLGRATLRLMSPRHRAALDQALRSAVLIASADRFALLVDARASGPGELVYGGVLSHRNLGVEDAVLSRPQFRAFYLEVVAPLEEGNRVARGARSLVVSRDGRRIAEITFADTAPALLDFTAPGVRRLPLAAER